MRSCAATFLSGTIAAVLALAAAHSPTAVAQEPPAAAAGDRIEGRVLDGLSRPLVAAEVRVLDADENEVAHMRTDGDGLFVFGRLPPGRPYWYLSAAAPGTIQARSWVRPRDGLATAVLRLTDAATVTGRVVDASGTAVPGAEVLASFNMARGYYDVRNPAKADDEGRFRLDRVPLGVIDVRAVAPGFRCGGVQVHVAGDRDVEVKLERGEDLRIDVVVEGLAGKDLAGAQVRLLPYVTGGLMYLPTSLVQGPLDDQGRWSARGLPQAEYLVSVRKDGVAFEPRELRMYTQFRGRVIGGPQQSPTTSPLATFRARRIAEFPLRGRLVDGDGKGIAAETVVARDLDNGRQFTAVTDADGKFTMPCTIAPGTVAEFTLRDSRLVPDQEQDESSASDKRNLARHRAKIDPSQEISIRAIAGAVVGGRLLTAAGTTVAFARVELEEYSPNRTPSWMSFATTTSRRDGTFEFVAHPMDVPARVAVDGAAGNVASADLALTAGAIANVGDLKLTPPAEITGTVRDAQGQPVPGARVWLRDWDFARGGQRSGSLVEVISDRNGRYRFAEVPPGGAWLQVTLHRPHPQDRAVEPFEVEGGGRFEFDVTVKE